MYYDISGRALEKKIRIGYVLKSADIGTLFSGRNSENSSKTYAHTSAYPCTPPIPMQAHAHQRHSHTPHTYPQMPTDVLNLIIHMKLHVNGNNHM